MDKEILLLAEKFGHALAAAAMVCTSAESCTGGLLGAAITSCPGSSRWFERGFVTYSNQAKIDLLAVEPGTLQAYGAVSEQTAAAMATGALRAARGASLALATTGIAGPDGASAAKPLGMVCFALAMVSPGREAPGALLVPEYLHTATEIFAGDRQQVRRSAVLYALNLALRQLAQTEPAG